MEQRQRVDCGVKLRPVREDDLEVFYRQQRDPVAAAMAAFPARERAAFFAHWHGIMARDDVLLCTVEADGHVAGNVVGFEQSGRREVGYWLGRRFWGRGIATAALHAFLTEETRRPLEAHVAAHNVASRRVLEKCGFRVRGEVLAGDVAQDGPSRAAGAEMVDELVLRLDPSGSETE
jgi:RimJ/RimL family protein N-acetyltransferase